MSRSLVARSHHEDPELGRVETEFYVDRGTGTAVVRTFYPPWREEESLLVSNAYTRAQLLERIRILRDLVVRLEVK